MPGAPGHNTTPDADTPAAPNRGNRGTEASGAKAVARLVPLGVVGVAVPSVGTAVASEGVAVASKWGAVGDAASRPAAAPASGRMGPDSAAAAAAPAAAACAA